MTHVAFVTPRYGMEVVGGAENGIRGLAERLVADRGWQAEVLTTTALDNRTWSDEYAAGGVDVNGVTVRRFGSERGRDPGFDEFSQWLRAKGSRASMADQERWVDLQGPVSAGLLGAIAASDADVVVFSPYLYHPIVHGLPSVGARAVFHPAAHEEPFIHFPIYERVFAAAAGFAYYTHVERQLVEDLFPPTRGTPSIVLGLGVDAHHGDPAVARAALGLGDRPYLHYQGRIDAGKGTSMLVELFAAYKRRRPGPLALVLGGPIDDHPPAHPDVIVAGPLEDSVRWGLYRDSIAYVHPSAFESFSIVLMDAWEAGRAALVNARCGATREHC
ncbi:MAG TPA: glycosyltransferase, partial [Acidimicrobiales bacterium]|nr:glycosyltransferase [Acidimicrobiales bacterium]